MNPFVYFIIYSCEHQNHLKYIFEVSALAAAVSYFDDQAVQHKLSSGIICMLCFITIKLNFLLIIAVVLILLTSTYSITAVMRLIFTPYTGRVEVKNYEPWFISLLAWTILLVLCLL